MNKVNALVIGANGGLGRALLSALDQSKQYSTVHAVVRQLPTNPIDNVIYHDIGEHTEKSVAALCDSLSQLNQQFTLAVSTLGVLHQGSNLFPEKRLEDLAESQLTEYFHTNSIIPALWLKHLPVLVKGSMPSKLVFFSARVGSISDNKLGGWYGYRASKAALNMLIKTAQVEYQRRAKQVSLVCYHPGTVDTGLSQPFQKNVAANKLFSPQYSVACLLEHLSSLDAELGPHYIDWQGKPIPW